VQYRFQQDSNKTAENSQRTFGGIGGHSLVRRTRMSNAWPPHKTARVRLIGFAVA
jgi:hypothetical protein